MSQHDTGLDIDRIELESVSGKTEYGIRAGEEGFLDHGSGMIFTWAGYWRTEMDPDQRRFTVQYVKVLSEKPRKILIITGRLLVRQVEHSEEKYVFELSRAEFNRSCVPKPSRPEAELIERWGGENKFFEYVLAGWIKACTFNKWRPDKAEFVVID